MTLVDTSVLVDSLAGLRRSSRALRSAIEQGERLALPSLVLFEWLRGPRLPSEIGAQEALFPFEAAIAFGPLEASVGAKLYGAVKRPRGREIDLSIAACAIVRDAAIWTLNRDDFKDIPQVRLVEFKDS